MAELCAPTMGVQTLSSIVAVESSGNPYAIGVVGGHLQRQPSSLEEAVATADMLEAAGYNYSLGLAQINRMHFTRFGMTRTSAFDSCVNLRASAVIWNDCLRRAGGSDSAFGDALSCYNSGNFATGYRNGYVTRVLKVRSAIAGTRSSNGAIDVIPDPPVMKRANVRVKSSRAAPEALLTASSNPKTDHSTAASTALLF